MILPVNEARLAEFAKSIELIASKVLEGWHFSPKPGSGVEFHSAAAYAEGEDMRKLDWKRYAASDRLYIKRFEQEQKSEWNLWMDSSESMSFGTKSSYAHLFAGSILFLARTWGDTWNFLGLPKAGIEQAYQDLASQNFQIAAEDLYSCEVKNSYVFLLSDFFYNLEDLKKWIFHQKNNSNRIILIQTLDIEELSFSFGDVMQFEDLESPSKMLLDSRMVRSKYLEELLAHREELKSLTEPNAVYFFPLEAKTEELPEHLLKVFQSL